MSMNDKPWAAPGPTRHIENLPLVLSVWDLQNDVVIRKEFFNYGNKEDRQMIGKITIWAVQEGFSVETMSRDSWDKLK